MRKSSQANQVLAIIRPLAGITLTGDTLSDITKLELKQVQLAVSALRQAGHPVHIIGHSKYVYDSSRPITFGAPRGRSVSKQNSDEPITLEPGHLLEVTRIDGDQITAIAEDGTTFILCPKAA